MINLQRYVMICEGGAGGHMAHPIDYTDFTGEQLIELVDNLFSGKVETMKEKLCVNKLIASKKPQIIALGSIISEESNEAQQILWDLVSENDVKTPSKILFYLSRFF